MTVLCALLGHEARPNEFLAKIFGMKGLPATLPRPLEWEAVSNLDWPWLVCTSRIHFGLNLRGEGVADRSTLQARGTSSADELNVGLIAETKNLWDNGSTSNKCKKRSSEELMVNSAHTNHRPTWSWQWYQLEKPGPNEPVPTKLNAGCAGAEPSGPAKEQAEQPELKGWRSLKPRHGVPE